MVKAWDGQCLGSPAPKAPTDAATVVGSGENISLQGVFFTSDGTLPVKVQVAGHGEIAGFRMLATAPAAQGRGVGAALTLACVERARGERAPGIALHTTSLMPAAQRLYHRLGFERWHDLDGSVGQKRPVQILGFRMRF